MFILPQNRLYLLIFLSWDHPIKLIINIYKNLLNVVNKEECVNAVSDLALRLLTTDPVDMKLDGNTPADH